MMGFFDFLKQPDNFIEKDEVEPPHMHMLDISVDEADNAGLPVNGFRSMLGDPHISVEREDRDEIADYTLRLDGELARVTISSGTVRVRYWSRKGAPDVEFAFSGPPACAINYARVKGERII